MWFKCYLFLINKHPTGLCFSCSVPETISHYLLQCSAYTRQRRKLERSLKKQPLNLSLLLQESSFDHVLRFIKDTGKLEII